MNALDTFRDAVGESGAVCVRGGGTRWAVGGLPRPGTREVVAPSGVKRHDPAEMIVSVGAGTPLGDLREVLRPTGQETTLDGPDGCTVGGVLAVGHSSLRRARVGALTDALLEANCVGANGRAFTAGGPTVKNVTGYDLCRLLVGSLGTLALMGEVLLRTRPTPEHAMWLEGEVEPDEVAAACYRPSCVLWDGTTTSVCLEGYQVDVVEEVSILRRLGFREVGGSPVLPPFRARWAGNVPEGAVLEIGTGVLHQPLPADLPVVDPAVARVAGRVKVSFDPTGRLNPGRDPYREAA